MINVIDKICGQFLERRYLQLSVILTVTFLLYINVLNGVPQFDDAYFYNQPGLQSSDFLKKINLIDILTGSGRPVAGFTFFLNYYFFGSGVFSYHLTNLFIHLFSGIIAYCFIYNMLTMPINGSRYANKAHFISLMTSGLFLIHPIQTQAVSYMVQRMESLASLFYLLAMLVYIKFIQSKGFSKMGFIILFIVSFVLGLGTKQIVFTLPFTVLIFAFLFSSKQDLFKNIALPIVLLCMAMLAAIYVISPRSMDPNAGYNLVEMNATEYFYTQINVLVTYLRMLAFPVGQSVDHAYPTSFSFWEARTVLSASFLFALVFISIRFFKAWPAGSFFLLWFFIILVPTSSLYPFSDKCVEHRLYLPSLGIYFIFVSSLFNFGELLKEKVFWRNFKIVTASFLVVLTISLCAATYKRNSLWKSNISLWQDAVKKSPKKARVHLNLAGYYAEAGNKKMALRENLIALGLNPGFTEVYYNMADIYEFLGMKDLARDMYIVFAQYNEEHKGTIREILSKYKITKETPTPDLIELKRRAIEAYNKLYHGKKD